MRIGLISCTKKKINDEKKHPAKDLYCSELFKRQLMLSQKETEKTYILSAEFGLVELDDELPYYNKTLVGANKNAKEKWAEKVLLQLDNKGIRRDGENSFIFYTGCDYFLPLKDEIKQSTKRFNYPIGKLLQALKEAVNV